MYRIFYLMSGAPHLPYLTVSLYTLRKYWTDEIWVHAWPESIDIVRRMARDDRLGIGVSCREPRYRGKNDQFMDKMEVAMSYHSNDVVLYLDADTTIHGRLERILDAAAYCGFAATQFCDWTTQNGIVRGRLETLREFPGIPTDMLDQCLFYKWPSVNGGIWAAKPNASLLRVWYSLTDRAKTTFIADEKVLHLLQPIFIPQKQMVVLEGGRWNCSTMDKFYPKALKESDIVIRHYHGDSNVRPDKSPKGHALWWSLWERCLHENIGGCREWAPTIRNKYMDQLKSKTVEVPNA